jgi:hypothetical protein
MLRIEGARAMLVGPVSTWLQANSWANAQTSPIQSVIMEQVAADASLASAHSNYFLGTAGLVASAAAKRLQANGKPEAAALGALIAAAGNLINKLA